jgi:multidrug resistance efflux pump
MAEKKSFRRNWRWFGVGAILVLTAAAVFAWRWWNQSYNRPPENVLHASGTIEVEEIEVASELGGRVTALYVDEGDAVEQGQVLIKLDDALVLVQLKQAEAAVQMAESALKRALQGATPEEVQQATAALSQTIAAQQGAKLVWEAAQALVDDPQQVTAQYHSALGMRNVAEEMIVNTEQSGGTMKETSRLLWYNSANNLRDAQAAYSLIYWQNREAEQERELTQEEIEAEAAAWRRVEDTERLMQIGEMNYNLAVTLEAQNNAIAQANLQTAQMLSWDMGEMIENPLSIVAQAAQAEASYLQAEAAVEVAQAALDRALAGANEAELEVLRAQVAQAEAAFEALQLQLERTTLLAPVSGIVLVRSIHQGELASPGFTLLTLGNLDTVHLNLYIPEHTYGRVQLGHEVRIHVDSYPGQVFSGQVIHIASRAEFTPKDVQTPEERVHLVYAVRVSVPNPEHLLKPGMPADAEIFLEGP